MNTKKIFAMIIALIMTTATFAGCGNSVDHDEHKESEVSSTVEKDSDKKSETAEKTEKDKKDSTQSKTDKKADSTAKNAEKNSNAETSNKTNSDSSTKPSENVGNSNSGSVSKPNTGSGNSSTGNNENHNGSVNKPSKPSGGNNSNTENSGNHNGDSKPAEKPAPHVHNFNIWKDEVNHTEMVTEEYTEQVPKYKYEAHYVCKKCGFDSTDIEVIGAHCLDCDGTYKHVAVQVQDGFETVTKTREVPKTIVDDPAHYECSCGARQ